VLDQDIRRSLTRERQELSLRFQQEQSILQNKIYRMNAGNINTRNSIANKHLVNLSEQKHVLGKMDLVFSEGKALTQFQEYMIEVRLQNKSLESMEPFKDGKLDLVVFLKLYQLLLEKMIDNYKSSESQIAIGAESIRKTAKNRFSTISEQVARAIET